MTVLLCVFVCVRALGCLPLGLNGTVLLHFHAAVNWSYGERCYFLRCDVVRVAIDASRRAVGRAQAGREGVVPVSHHGCPGLIQAR